MVLGKALVVSLKQLLPVASDGIAAAVAGSK